MVTHCPFSYWSCTCVLTITFKHLDYDNYRSLFLLAECFVPCFLFSLWSSGLSGQKFWWLMSLQVYTIFPWEFCGLWLLSSCLFVPLEVSLTPVMPDCSSGVPTTILACNRPAVALCSNGCIVYSPMVSDFQMVLNGV